LTHDEERRGQRQFFEHWYGVVEIVTVTIVEGNREMAVDRLAALELRDKFSQRKDPEVPPEELAILPKRAPIDR
jgi:hypothetical protein